MSKWKSKLNRVLALGLAGILAFSVPEFALATENVAESDIVREMDDAGTEESTQKNDVENPTIIYEETVDLGTVETSAPSMSFFAGTNAYVSLKNGNHADWIDRIDVPDYAISLYNALAEGVDNDGIEDVLIDDAYFDEDNTILVTSITSASDDFDHDKVYAEIRAVYDAFDRDYPEVFWLSGETTAKTTISSVTSNGVTSYTATYYFIIKDHNEAFDIRESSYQSETAIESGISTRDAAISTIRSGLNQNATDVEKMEYFNDWLTKHNEYNTIVAGGGTGSSSDHECLSALTGSIGTDGPVCEGYARAFKVLCDVEGIPCVLVDGDATSDGTSNEAHMWNYVQADGKWYAVDVTWNDPTGGAAGAVSGYERDEWFLLGSDTVVFSAKGVDWTFIESHPVSNSASLGGVSFTNGPVLSEDAYVPESVVDDGIESVTISSTETTYGYTTDDVPVITVTLKNGATGTVSYQWYYCAEDGTKTKLENATENILPYGMDAGTYECVISYNGEEAASKTVVVNPKEITVAVDGYFSKEYDGTTDISNEVNVLSLRTDDIITGDKISLTGAVYAFEDANAGDAADDYSKNVIASGYSLSGSDAHNYVLANQEAEGLGSITPLFVGAEGVTVEITLDETQFTYTGEPHTANVVKVVVNGMEVPEDSYSILSNSATEAGPACVEIQLSGNFEGYVSGEFEISYLDAADALSKLTFNGEKDVKAYYNTDLVIQAEGYQISDGTSDTFADVYTLSDETYHNISFLRFKEKQTGYITDLVNMTETIESDICIDKTDPIFNDWQGISVNINTWRELLNTITFGVFFNDYMDVSIYADDYGAGIANYYYYVDNSGSEIAKKADELDEITFTEIAEGETFQLNPDGNYVIYAYAMDNAGNKSTYICSDGIVIDTIDPIVSDIVEPTVDNGNLKDTSAVITFISNEAGEFEYYLVSEDMELLSVESDVEVENSDAQMEDGNVSSGGTVGQPGTEGDPGEGVQPGLAYEMMAGENVLELNDLSPNTTYTVTIVAYDKAWNQSQEVTVTFTTLKTLPVVTENPVITGIYGEAVKDMMVSGGMAETAGTWSIAADETDIPVVGTQKSYTVVFTPEDDVYETVSVEVVPVVEKKTITVIVDDVTKKFGEDNPGLSFTVPENLLVGNDTTEDLSVALSTMATKTSSVGEYAITAISNAANYDVSVIEGLLIVEKADAPKVDAISKSFIYSLGSEEKTIHVDLDALLPEDRGVTSYTFEMIGKLLSEAAVDAESEALTFKVSAGELNDTAAVTITAISENYKDAVITINVKLVEKMEVSLSGTVTTVGTLVYGDALSKLTFGEVKFVDAAGTPVAGTITWDTPSQKLVAGTHSVAWTFTPADANRYETASGTVSVTVEKAVPVVETLPTASAIVYGNKLTDSKITGGKASVNGTWAWKNADIAPSVADSKTGAYGIVFTPEDTANYQTVEKTITIEVMPVDISDWKVVLDTTNLTYNGNAQTVKVISIGETTLTENVDYTVSGNTQTKAGDYTVTVTAKGNYTGTATAAYSMKYLSMDKSLITYNGAEKAEWYAENVVIKAEGYTVADTLDGSFAESYTIDTEGKSEGITLYFKENATGYITDAVEIETVSIDKTAPSFAGEGSGITVKENIWKKLLDSITFGIFDIETYDVVISAADEASGVADYYYYVDESGSTEVKSIEALDALNFTKGSRCSLDEDGRYVVYAYAVDKAGNKSAYICSNGLVLDQTAPAITEVVKPSTDNGNLKDTSAVITFVSNEAGTFAYTVSAGETECFASEKGLAMSAGNNNFTVNGLSANTAYTVVLTAQDELGNTTKEMEVSFTTLKNLPVITENPIITGTYGDAVKDMNVSGGTVNTAGTWSIATDETDVPEVGTEKAYTVVFTPDASEYETVSVEVVPTVAKKAISVTIDNVTKVYGTDNPVFTFTISIENLVGDDTKEDLSITLSTDAVKTSNAGEYAIKGVSNAKNYDVTVKEGTLTVQKAEIPSNAPEKEMKVKVEKVSDVTLPDGWKWADADADKAIVYGETLKATARYIAEDAINYETTEVVVSITGDKAPVTPSPSDEKDTVDWDEVKEEIKNSSSGRIVVMMRTPESIHKDVLRELAISGKNLVLDCKQSNGDKYSWTIHGSRVSFDDLKDSISMEVRTFNKSDANKPAISERLIQDVVQDEGYLYLSLRHDGSFGFSADLELEVGNEYLGKYASLYYYNPEQQILTQTRNVNLPVRAGGIAGDTSIGAGIKNCSVEMLFDHASDYIIVFHEQPIDIPTTDEEPVVPPTDGEHNTETPSTGGESNTNKPSSPPTGDIVIGYMVMLLAGAVMVFKVFRKKRI